MRKTGGGLKLHDRVMVKFKHHNMGVTSLLLANVFPYTQLLVTTHKGKVYDDYIVYTIARAVDIFC